MTIHVIGPFHPSDSNIYLLTGSINVLVDTGLGLNPGLLLSSIRSIVSDLDLIILTHCHVDHVGGLFELMNEFDCRAVAMEPDSEHIRQADSHTLADLFGIKLKPVHVDSLSDGEVLDLVDHRLRVISTPGHTEGGMCLFDEVTSSLLSGDTLFVNGVGRTDFPSGSLNKLRSSLALLDEYEFVGLYPGHGEVSKSNGKMCLAIGMRMVGD